MHFMTRLVLRTRLVPNSLVYLCYLIYCLDLFMLDTVHWDVDKIEII